MNKEIFILLDLLQKSIQTIWRNISFQDSAFSRKFGYGHYNRENLGLYKIHYNDDNGVKTDKFTFYDENGNEIEVEVKRNLHKIRSVAYLKEAIGWNSDGNFDRVSAMGMLMIYRESLKTFIVTTTTEKIKSLASDPFFQRKSHRRANSSRIQLDLLNKCCIL